MRRIKIVRPLPLAEPTGCPQHEGKCPEGCRMADAPAPAAPPAGFVLREGCWRRVEES